ncbi:MAG TPA: hypothetical protein VGJ04_05280 [Pirellulales bacterium]
MKTTQGLVVAGVVCGTISQAVAQNGVQNSAQVPTTVQLPTFHYFTSTGSVLVPDGGDVFLGGLGGAAAGRTQQGIPGLPSQPFTNSATGASVGASNVSVSAQIHAFDAMDKALLGGAVVGNDFRPPLVTRQDSGGLQSVVAIRAQQAAGDAARDRLAGADLERGRELVAAGKFGVAKIYFQTAAKKAVPGGDVYKHSLAGLEQSKAAAKVAGQ